MDLQLTKNNHFQFGYDSLLFNQRQSPEQKWIISYGHIDRAVQDWKNECILAARDIAIQSNRQIYICLSGGIDSEVTIESFRLAGVPVIAAVMRFKDQLNAHDIFWAERYCHRHRISIEYYDVDALGFYKTQEYQSIVDSTQCFYPMLSLQMKVMSWVVEKKGFPVLGSAECYLERLPNQKWVLYEREIYAALYRYQIQKKFEGVCGFFQWSPEMMYSFLVDPMIKKLIHNELLEKNNSLEIKQDLYSYYFQTEPRKKYYGWEKFSLIEEGMRQELLRRFHFARTEIKTPYEEVLKILNPKDL